MNCEWNREGDTLSFHPDTIIIPRKITMPNGKKERTAQRSMARNYPKPFSSAVFCLRLFSDSFGIGS
jgi:hypothetical protein